MSEGITSGVNWMRLKLQPMEREIALASVVLPMPGTSSISKCPSESSATSTRSITSLWPTMTRAMFSRTRSATALICDAAAVAALRSRLSVVMADSVSVTDNE